jgi:predicted nucleotidyltransferase
MKAYHDKGLKIRYIELSDEEKDKLLMNLKERLKSDDEIIFAYVHGSFINRKLFRDIDVALWLKTPHMAFNYTVNFSTKLSMELGLPVDIQILNEAPLPFKHQVFKRGKLLHSKDEKLRIEKVDQTLRNYFDLKQLTELCTRPPRIDSYHLTLV